MGGAVEIDAEPFVRVEDDGIGVFDAAPEMAELRADHRGASPGRVDMNIKAMTARDVADACNVIRAADTGAADAGNDAGGQKASLLVGYNGGLQRGRIEAAPFTDDGNAHKVVVANTCDPDGAVDRGM